MLNPSVRDTCSRDAASFPHLVRAGTDQVTVAELLGHSRVETVRIYSRPTETDKVRALEHLAVDEKQQVVRPEREGERV